MSNILIHRGRLVGAGELGEADVRIVDGRVAEIGALTPRNGERAISAAGCFVLPGLVDLHVHLADEVNGVPIADGFASGTEAAVRGGVTTVCSFVTQRPGEGLGEAVARMVTTAAGACHGDVSLHLTPTGESWDWATLADLTAAGLTTVKLYTTYRQAGIFTPYDRLEIAMGRLARLGLGLLVHCEDEDELAAAAAEVEPGDARGHGRLRPPLAEIRAVDRVVSAAARTGCRTHIVHVSTPEAAERVASARRAGAAVSCETGPQYLLLDNRVMAPPGGHRLLCTPPLRSPAIRGALVRALLAGDIDLLATDHCPFTRTDKDDHAEDFRRVPNGLPGVGALLDLAWELLVVDHHRSPTEVVRLCAATPARVAGLAPHKGALEPGADADLVILDPNGPERAVRPTLADVWSPWQSRTTHLALRHVLLRGEEVVRDGELVEPVARRGRVVAPRV